MLKTVKQILDEKGYEIWSVSPDDSVYDALKNMADKNIGALLVLEGDELVGIISERDYARKVMLKGKSSMDTPVRDIMTPRVLYIRTNQSIEECMALMTDKRIRHLPVFDQENLVGVISIGDVVKAIISHQEFVIEQLENYITVGR
ncbi:MAG TPA: CBS domain-containing protein [Anaerolineales bacterium]|jgi:CBS domain-containing protein